MQLLRLALPPACAGCGRYGVALCSRCLRGFRPASREDDRFLAADPGVVVGDQLELALAAFAHDDALRRVLQRLKYGGASGVAPLLAAAALPAFGAVVREAPRGAPLVPVPVHRERLRQRGYNQAALLAEALSGLTGRRTAELLVRRRATTRQHHLDRAARLHNLRAAFAVAAGARPPPVVILVDDIVTSAATLEACAGALRGSGTTRVMALAVAREV